MVKNRKSEPELAAVGAPDDLAAALVDLDGAIDEASEEEFRPPSHSTVVEARRILRQLYSLSPRRFEVYPTPDGEIALDAHADLALLFYCWNPTGALSVLSTSPAIAGELGTHH